MTKYIIAPLSKKRSWALYSVQDGRAWSGAPILLNKGPKANLMITARLLAGRTGAIEVLAR